MQIASQSLPNPTLIRSRDAEVKDDRNSKKQKTETCIDHTLIISPLDASSAKPLAQLTVCIQDQQPNLGHPTVSSLFSNNFHVQDIIEHKQLGDNYFETDKISAFQCYMTFIEKDGPQLFPQSNADFYKKLGDMWFNGWGCEKNDGKALNYYEQASFHGNMAAHKKLGEMHLFGQGVISNGWKAIEYLQHPQLQNDPDVLLLLGDLYFNVYKGFNDYITTSRYNYCTVDPNFALLESTVLYLNDLEGRIDNQLALTHYLSAANKGNPEAWLRLGLMLISGVTLSEQMNEEAALEGAVEYFFRSVEGGCLHAYNSLAPLAISQENNLRIDPQKMQYVLRGRDSLLNINQRIDENIKRQYGLIIVHLKNNFIKKIKYIANTIGKEEIIRQTLDEAFFKLNSSNIYDLKSANDLLIKLDHNLLEILRCSIWWSPGNDKILPTHFIKHQDNYRFDYLNEWTKRDATSLKMAISCFLAAEDNQILAGNWDGSIGHEITNMDKVRKFLKADKKKGHLYAGKVMQEVGPGWDVWDEDILYCITQQIPKITHFNGQCVRSLSNLKLVSKTFNETINAMISNLFVARFTNLKENDNKTFFEFASKFKSVSLVIDIYSENIFQQLIKKDLPHVTALKITFDAGEYMTLKALKRLPSKLKKLDVFCDFQSSTMLKLIARLNLVNNITLKKFVLRAPHMENNQLVELGKSLENNSILEKLQLRSGSLYLDSDFHVLLKNNSLNELKILVDKHNNELLLNDKFFDAIKTSLKLTDFTIMPILNNFNGDDFYQNSYSNMIDTMHEEYFEKVDFDDHKIEREYYQQLAKIEPFLERNRDNAKKI